MKACHNHQERLSAKPGNFVHRRNERIFSRTFKSPVREFPETPAAKYGLDTHSPGATFAQHPPPWRRTTTALRQDGAKRRTPLIATLLHQLTLRTLRSFKSERSEVTLHDVTLNTNVGLPGLHGLAHRRLASAHAVQVDMSWLDERDRHVPFRATPGATQARIESWPGRRAQPG